MKYHVEGNPYKCDLCHYDAKSAQTLMRHKKVVHERILPHICQFCGKRFAIISNMKKHIGEFQNKMPEGSTLVNRQLVSDQVSIIFLFHRS